MGRRATFSTDDYADRILGYLRAVGESSTQEIMEGITGTHYRLMEGAIQLLRTNKVKIRSVENGEHLMWRIND